VEQGGVDAAHQHPQPLDEIIELLGAQILGDGAAQRPVGVGEVAQHDALRALQPVALDELREGLAGLVDLPDDGLGGEVLDAHPGAGLRVDLQRRLEVLLQGFGQVTSSSCAMRSVYSTPSAFSSARSSPLAAFCWASRIWRGSSRIDSMIEPVSRGRDSDSSSRVSIMAIARGASGWFIVKSSCR